MGPKPGKTIVPIKRGNVEREKGKRGKGEGMKMPRKGKGRNQGDVSKSQGMPKTARRSPEARQMFPSVLRRNQPC